MSKLEMFMIVLMFGGLAFIGVAAMLESRHAKNCQKMKR